MINKILLPIGFVLVGILCLYPWLSGKSTSSDYKIIAGLICIAFGVGSLFYDMVVKRKK